jgi:hypothetical protein
MQSCVFNKHIGAYILSCDFDRHIGVLSSCHDRTDLTGTSARCILFLARETHRHAINGPSSCEVDRRHIDMASSCGLDMHIGMPTS